MMCQYRFIDGDKFAIVMTDVDGERGWASVLSGNIWELWTSPNSAVIWNSSKNSLF